MLVFLPGSACPSLLFSCSLSSSCSGEMMGLQEMSGGAARAAEEEGRLSTLQEVSSLTGSRAEEAEMGRDYQAADHDRSLTTFRAGDGGGFTVHSFLAAGLII